MPCSRGWDQGIDVRFNAALVALEGQAGDLTAVVNDGLRLPCGGVLMATGRRPWLADLGLELAGVAVDNGRIVVDADSRTSVPHIHAVGDVTDRVNLTPVAIDEGRAYADAVFAGKHRQVDHALVASAVFSDPELASVGLSEEQAVAEYGSEAVVVHRARFRSMARALPASGSRCLLKLVVEASPTVSSVVTWSVSTPPRSFRWLRLRSEWGPPKPISIAPWRCIPPYRRSSSRWVDHTILSTL